MAGTTQPRKRGEGQWALGYFEPLNPAERVKRDDDGLHVRTRADVVVYDPLASPALLGLALGHAERVRRQSLAAPMAQEAISALVVERGLAGQAVVLPGRRPFLPGAKRRSRAPRSGCRSRSCRA
jgi:hypothetical protein